MNNSIEPPDDLGTPLSPTIQFLIPVEDGDPIQATFLQGFAPSLLANTHLVRLAAFFPTNIYDLTPEGKQLFTAVRMGGANPIRWYGQSPKALLGGVTPPSFAFTILLFGHGHDFRNYASWIDAHAFPITVVTETNEGTFTYEDFNVEALGEHFLLICERIQGLVDDSSLEAAKKAIASWSPLEPRSLGYQVKGHNTVIPNLMALTAAGFDDMVSGEFDNILPRPDWKPYVDQIVKTAGSVVDERRRVGLRQAHNLYPPPPDLNLFAPSVFPHFFELDIPTDIGNADDRRKFRAAQRVLRGQSGYKLELTGSQAKSVFDLRVDGGEASVSPHFVIRQRAAELTFATDCVGALAASQCAPVLRLPNEVNRTSGQVRQFANHYRSERTTEWKRVQAFRRIQSRISESVPPEFSHFIENAQSGVRVIADTHLEWLKMKSGLPLCLDKDTARIPTTPGNLFVDQLRAADPVHIPQRAFTDILLLSALNRDDPIRPFFDSAFRQFGRLWENKITIQEVSVPDENSLVEAINDFQGAFVIFDGHGSHAPNEPGYLYLMNERVDVWQLRGRIKRPPPVVLLSACDTHAADRNHATAGNGFLSLGTRAVLSSVFPLHAMDAAIFAARLVYRISDFLPAAFEAYKRSLTWLEIVSGMLRMQLLTDFTRTLQSKGVIDEAGYYAIHNYGNMAINALWEKPFELILEKAAEVTGQSMADLTRLLELATAKSSAISYLHLGRPETIIVHPNEESANTSDLLEN